MSLCGQLHASYELLLIRHFQCTSSFMPIDMSL
jgi:hypothetical protein